MVSQGSAIRPNGLELHSCLGIRWVTVLTFALMLFIAISPIWLSSSSEMPRTAMLSNRASLSTNHVAKAYGKLPLSFEINQGQTDSQVKFISRGSRYSLFLTGNEAVLSLRKPVQ